LSTNNLEGFDSAGQLAGVYFIKNSFWPWPDGWNAMALSGFPQGLFYPSFLHWLAAMLGFVLPLVFSYKILLSLAILFFPIISFVLLKNIFKNNFLASFGTILISIFYFFETGLNDNLSRDLFYGTTSHLFSLSIFFLYLFFISRLLKSKINWRIPGFLLALSLFTHIITGAAAFIFALIITFSKNDDKLLKKNLIKHLLAAALLSLCWWLPFILNIKYTSGSDVNVMSAPLIIFFSPFIVLLNIASYKIKHEYELFF
jgi:hypothetical protein